MGVSRLSPVVGLLALLAASPPADAAGQGKEARAARRAAPVVAGRRQQARAVVRAPKKRAARPAKVYRPKRPLEVAVVGGGAVHDAIAARLALGGHQVVAGVERLPRVAGKPRVVLLTSKVGKRELARLIEKLSAGDIVVDATNATFEQTSARAARLGKKGIQLVDVGVSGAADGLERGFGLAIGGRKAAVKEVEGLFQSLAPGARTGWAHITDEAGDGVIGGGHLVRTVEAAVDNAFRQSLKEGLDVITKGSVKVDPQLALETWEVGAILTSELVGRALDLVSERGDYRSIAERETGADAENYRYSVVNGIPNLTLAASFQSLAGGRPAAESSSRRAAARARSGRQALDRKVARVYKPKRKLTVGMIGLGRMGAGVSHRLLDGGHKVVGYNRSEDGRKALRGLGGEVTESVEALVASLPTDQPRVVWMYLPAGEATEQTIEKLGKLLSPGDIIVDGGNSDFKRTIAIGKQLAKKGIRFVDVGTSGGVLGYENGYAMMVGGPNDAVDHLTPALESVAPGKSTGWAHIRDRKGNGIRGGGHFVKMVHNGIEYAWMSALAEGLDNLRSGPSKVNPRKALKVWDERGPLASLITAITRRQLDKLPAFEGFSNRVPDTGEGRRTVLYAAENQIPVQVLSAGMVQRLATQGLLDGSIVTGVIQNQTRQGFNGSPPPRVNDQSSGATTQSK